MVSAERAQDPFVERSVMKKLRCSRGVLGFNLAGLLAPLLIPGAAPAQLPYPIGPAVNIVSPANHATFYSPVDIPIFAQVRPQPEIVYTNVEFFADTNDLGRGFRLGVTNLALRPIYGNVLFSRPVLGTLYCLVWTNAPAGSFALTAVASGFNEFTGAKLSRTSAPVNITILVSSTNTNPTDVVSIVASDPIAIAGTNAYWTWLGTTNSNPTWTNWPPPRWQLITNWGPKAALFTVRRFGDASDALTVNYGIGGTASNGLDYAALPGFVTIPAGGAYSLIPIVPLDHGTSAPPKTVTLTLQPSTNTPPDYLVGFPSHPTVLILTHWPRPLPPFLPDGTFHFNAAGPDGAWFCWQASSDLLNWSTLATNQVFQGSINVLDADAPENPTRFYRALPVDEPPSQ
jgi:hypothetical protein